jgi:sigma-B regulation protein RsbU (phosphoserine phosphatase)
MNMTTSTQRMPDLRQRALGNALGHETKRQGNPSQGLPATTRSFESDIPSLKQELDAVRRGQAKLQQAIYEAAQIQRKLCAPRELVWGEFEIAGEIFPVRHLSGDFFKVMELDSALGVTVGDIAGKGMSAGIWQAHLMGLIRRCARAHSDPAAAVAQVNAELCQDQDEPPIAALFFARLDPQENELVYCNAGLPAPLLLRQNKTVERLEKGGPMLGALQGAAYSQGSVRLNPGDMLIAYSDGVTECRNSQDEEFEMGRLSAAVNAVGGACANQVLFSTLGAVLDFANACPPEDDLTLLVIRRRESAMSGRPHSRSKDFSAPHREPASVVRPKKAEWRGNHFK